MIEEFTRTDDGVIDGVGPYPVDHAYSSAAALAVWLYSPDDDPDVLLDPSLYSMAPASSDVNGDLTLDAATAATYDGWTLHVERRTPITLGWTPVQTAREKSLEAELRRLTLGLQDVAEQQKYTMRLTQDGNAITPARIAPADRANRTLVFDAAGTGLTVGPSTAELSEAVSAAATAVAARIAAEAAEAAAETAAAEAVAAAQAGAASEAAAELAAINATNAATQTLAVLVAAGAQLYATTAAGIAATPDGGMFMVPDAAGVRLYQRSGSSAVPGRYLTRPAFASIADLSASGVGLAGELRFVTGRAGGVFEWKTQNFSNECSWDFQMGIWVPPTIALSGSGGAWVRQLDGYLSPQMFGADGGADDTEAIVCMDNVLRELSPAFSVRFTDNHVTDVGMGDLNITHTYATQAEADAALSGLDEHSVVYVTADKKRWRVKDGAFQKMSTRSMNKKVLYADGLNACGLVLGAGAHAKQRLFAGSFQQGGIFRVRFNGNNPSLQWGDDEAAILAQQVNPDTEELVFVEGYGYHLEDVTVRFSGGNGIRLRGIIGAVTLSGRTVAQYCIGRGIVIDQMSALSAYELWTEGNDAGGTLLDYDVLLSNATGQGYWKLANISIATIYDENAADGAPVVEIKGGHFGPRIGPIAKQGTGIRQDIKLTASAGADEFWTGCQGGLFDMGAQVGVWIECDQYSKNNVFKRQSGLWTSQQNDAWDVRDSGIGNVFEWDALDEAAFAPGSVLGDVSINAGSSNFTNNSGSSAQLTNALGGVVGPIQDYHSNYTTGPGHVVASGFNTLNGGTEINFSLSLNANLPATSKTWYMVVLAEVEAHQLFKLALWDVTSGNYYNWHSESWLGLGAQDAFGAYRTIRADRTHFAYIVPFENDGTARQVRPNIRLKGGGEARLYHAWVTDHPRPALTGIRLGQCLGTPANAVSTTTHRAPATVVPVGTSLFNVTTTAWEVSNGTTWLSAALT